MVLICVSLLISDVEHLSIYLLAICMSSSEKMFVYLFCPFLIKIFFAVEVNEFFTYFGYYSLMIYKYFIH